MARLPRLVVPGQVHHLLHWGHNKGEIFLDDVDALTLLDILTASASKCDVAIHAWLLMPNHLHLLATPNAEHSLRGMMQSLGRDYVRQFNRRHGRSGTLWAGRYRSSLVEPQDYLLPSMVFLDLHPIRSGLVDAVANYPWSSYGSYVGLPTPSRFPKLSTHTLVWHLGNTPFAREARYRELVDMAYGSEKQDEIIAAVRGGWALGSDQYVEQVQRLTSRRLSKLHAGRPAKLPDSETGNSA